MIFIPMWDGSMGCSSYLVGDATEGRAVIVDPLQNLGADSYILSAAEMGLEIVAVVETHVHADHHSAAHELADKVGVKLSLSHNAPAAFEFNPLHDHDVIDLGRVKMEIWETPGHTPDSISLLIKDTTRSDEPWAVLTGDSLFVGDVGRPDLADPTPESTEAAARDQFRSVNRLMDLPDTTEIYPAHYGASSCGGLFLSPKPMSTIGFERKWNRFMQLKEPQEFSNQLLALLKPPPEGAQQIRSKNLGQPH